MWNKIIKIISIAMIITIAFVFSSFSLATTEGEFADIVKKNERDWFWKEPTTGRWTHFFGKRLDSAGEAAKRQNGACVYHLQTTTGSSKSYVTNLIEFEGNMDWITIYGGKDSNPETTDGDVCENANAVAKVLYQAFHNKGNKRVSSKWGAAIQYVTELVMHQKVHGLEVKDRVNSNFDTEKTNTYTPAQRTAGKNIYNKALNSRISRRAGF